MGWEKNGFISLAILSLCSAETINITGTTVDNAISDTVTGVVVRLKGTNLVDTSFCGNFSLKGDATVATLEQAALSAPQLLPSLAADGIRLALAQAGQVVVSGHGLDGKQLMRSEQVLSAGAHVIGFGMAARGVFFYRVRANGNEYVLRQVGVAPGTAGSASIPATHNTGLVKGRAAKAYTLVASRAGYKTVEVSASGPTATKVVIALTATDTIMDLEGNVYPVITIGTQTWTTRDLRSTRLNDGTAIPGPDESAWPDRHGPDKPAYGWYKQLGNDDAALAAATKHRFGACYSWGAVITGKLAPKGWHVATDHDWWVLAKGLGGDSVAGNALRECDTFVYWYGGNLKNRNQLGFSARGCGWHYYNNWYDKMRALGLWWSALNPNGEKHYNQITAAESWGHFCRMLIFDSAAIQRYSFGSNGDKMNYGAFVRLVKD